MHDQPSSQVCPICGLPPQHAATTTDGRLASATCVVTATLVCALDHLWLVKWTVQQPAQAAEVAR